MELVRSGYFVYRNRLGEKLYEAIKVNNGNVEKQVFKNKKICKAWLNNSINTDTLEKLKKVMKKYYKRNNEYHHLNLKSHKIGIGLFDIEVNNKVYENFELSYNLIKKEFSLKYDFGLLEYKLNMMLFEFIEYMKNRDYNDMYDFAKKIIDDNKEDMIRMLEDIPF